MKAENKILVAEKNKAVKENKKHNNHAKSLQVNSKENPSMSMFLTNNNKSSNTNLCRVNKSPNKHKINLDSNDLSSIPSEDMPVVASESNSVNDTSDKDVKDLGELVVSKAGVTVAGVEDLEKEKGPSLPKLMPAEDLEPVNNEKPVTKDVFLKLMAEFREQQKADREEIFKDFWKK